jgi:DNA mismatch repair protein MutL
MAIKVLPSHVADAIAAGEVVERPASVVKELVENALDAGGRRLTVEVRGAGRTLVRVTDDGAGIPGEDLELAFQRHATSKLAELADLEAIGTLGFRGEALASVAAVADVECRSQGARIRIRGGEVLERAAAIPTPGTVLEMRDLFARTPARLKFLKSDATETAACVKAVQAYALLYPHVRFELSVDGRTALRTPGSGELRAAIGAVLGERVAGEMREAVGEGVRGMVSEPRLSRGGRDAILLAVNHRPIASRSLTFAIEECYLGSLEKGRYPITVLDLELDPGELDVNVHPAKREVRFRAERAVFASVQRAVRSALTGSRPYQLAPPPPSPAMSTALHDLRQPTLHEPRPVYDAPPAGPVPPTAAGMLRPLGQVDGSYLIAEGAEGLVLVDQHAAHERILYNRFLLRLQEQDPASQALLLPETLDAEPGQVAAASDHGDRLRALGFAVEPFGPGMLRLLAGPAETPPERLPAALLELLTVLADSRPEDSRERMAASLACHSAVRFGDPLDPAEQRRLLQELESTDHSITCPHGRPTRLVLTWQELKQHFRRNY